MCGICGAVTGDSGGLPDADGLKRMCDTLTHRGPDDEGQIILAQAALGMRRLSIIDLNTGHQPLSNEDGTIWIVFNGEIYNYKDLRKELIALGHRFKTQSDTETIVHGYEAWGTGVCKKLNGIFGFAIWDDTEKRLVLGRDHLGVKPLYYYLDDSKLVFGSEIKAILSCPGIRRTIDFQALDHFLTFEYIPAPESIFKEIRKLESGHALVWQDGRTRIERYWTLSPREDAWKEGDAAE
ncbi:MAG TPA: asparagine synthase (glutamine-hydrolyzing), partial [bacterium]